MKEINHNRELKARAQELRKNMTRHERHLWYDFLNSYPVRFRRQVPIDRFILDFYCAAAKLAIELDGSQHYTEEAAEYDLERSIILQGYGIHILRFPNSDVDSHFSGVCELIDQTVKDRVF